MKMNLLMLASLLTLVMVFFLSGGDSFSFVMKGCNRRRSSGINTAWHFDSHEEITNTNKNFLFHTKLYHSPHSASSSTTSSLSSKSSSSTTSSLSSKSSSSTTSSLSSKSTSSSSSKFHRDLTKLVVSFMVSTSVLTGTMPKHSIAAGGSTGSPVLEAKIKQLETSSTRGEVVQSLADLFEVSGQNTLKARTKYKYRIVKAINDQRTKLTNDKVEWDEALRYESGELKRRVDPFRTVDLKGYLQVAPIVGGVAYLGALFVQQALPELFIFAYPLAVIIFTAPIVFIVVFG